MLVLKDSPGIAERLVEAEQVVNKAMTVHELRVGKFDPALSVSLSTLTYMMAKQGRQHEAEITATRALALAEQLGEHHPYIVRPSFIGCFE